MGHMAPLERRFCDTYGTDSRPRHLIIDAPSSHPASFVSQPRDASGSLRRSSIKEPSRSQGVQRKRQRLWTMQHRACSTLRAHLKRWQICSRHDGRQGEDHNHVVFRSVLNGKQRQRIRGDPHPRLLPQLPGAPLLPALICIDKATGQRPLPSLGRDPTANDQQPVVHRLQRHAHRGRAQVALSTARRTPLRPGRSLREPAATARTVVIRSMHTPP